MVLPLSPVIKVGSLVFISGVPPIDAGQVIGAGDVRAQTTFILKRIQTLLQPYELTLDHLAMVYVYLRSMDDYERMNNEYALQLSAPYPARKVMVTPLPAEGALIEISGIASCEDKRKVNTVSLDRNGEE